MSLTARELSHREYERLFSIAPDSDRVHQLLGEAALAAENKIEAEEEFQKALKANPHSIEVSTELAELKRSQSKFDEAIDFYTQAEQIGPLNYEIAYGLGACYTYKQQYSQAIDWLRKAVALAPDSAAAHFALGNALFQHGDYEAAIPELNSSLRLEPRMKQAYFLLGRADSKLGRQEEARAALRKLNELNRAEVPGQEKESTSGAIRSRIGPSPSRTTLFRAPCLSSARLFGNLDEHDAMHRNFRGEGILHGAEILVIQKIAELCGGRHANDTEVKSHLYGRFAAIEKSYSLITVGERFDPDFQRAFSPNAASLYTFRVLVDCENFGIRKEFFRLGRHVAQIVSREKWSGKQRP